MKKIKCVVVATLFLALFAGSSGVALAQTGTSSQALVNQVQSLMQQIKTLQDQIAALNNQGTQLRAELQQTLQLTQTLRLGMTSEEVKILQEMLAADPSIYPEGLVTGYFGSLTEKAVRKFQAKHGIEQVGNVGPKTLAKINALLKSGASLPPGLAKKAGLNVASTTASTTASAVGDKKITICHVTGGVKTNAHAITISLSALPAHLTHGDYVGNCGTPSTPTVPTVDTLAPVVSNIASSTATTTAYVSWTTNELATSTLWYSTATPLSTSTATKIESNTFSLSHSYNITNLASTTTYYFVVKVSDASGNSVTSSEKTFLTIEN